MFNNKLEQHDRNLETINRCSLEVFWKANPYYWGGKIKIITVYINNQLRYNLFIPQEYKSPKDLLSVPLQTTDESSEAINIPHLTINNLSEIQDLTLKAIIFSGQNGSQISEVSMTLDVRSLQNGKHYNIIINHTMEKQQASDFWKGKFLNMIVEEAGCCKQTAALTPTPPSLTNQNFF